MRARVLIIVFVVSMFVFSAMAQANEVTYDPSTQRYDMNSQGVLNLWGATGLGSNALVANPDYDWPSPFAVAAWYAMLLKAQEIGLVVVVGYDPASLDIWYIMSPR